MGPYNSEDILKLYIAGKIDHEATMFVKNARDSEKDGGWCELCLETEAAELRENNKVFKDKFPELYSFLIPKMTELSKADKEDVK